MHDPEEAVIIACLKALDSVQGRTMKRAVERVGRALALRPDGVPLPSELILSAWVTAAQESIARSRPVVSSPIRAPNRNAAIAQLLASVGCAPPRRR